MKTPASTRAQPTEEISEPAEPDFAAIYTQQFSSLVRLAALLLDDVAASEDVVQEAYLRVSASQRRLRDPEKALAYLRQTVVNLSRSALRRRAMMRRHAPKPLPDGASAEDGAYAAFERAAVVQALRQLPRRSREALVLRYYLDLTEAQTAQALGISIGSVKSYCSRGLDRLATLLEDLT